MKFDVKEYRQHKETILTKFDKDGLAKTEEMCVVSAIALIPMFVFLNEEVGNFENSINDLLEFYGYTGYEG